MLDTVYLPADDLDGQWVPLAYLALVLSAVEGLVVFSVGVVGRPICSFSLIRYRS